MINKKFKICVIGLGYVGLPLALEFSKKLILETNVGVAPGIAFGQSGEGHIRICFAAKESFINQIMDRLEPILNKC